ncbi:hypothetical protein [Streptomyces sp. NPDC048242]|uniref:hypothetical protein n=1 Tax=Streptomyces sp. NPDC048242 TaxID=3155026 RepID=UPI003448CD54
MDRQTAVQDAAREVIAHGGPDCRTDPHLATTAMRHALDLGATHDDIAAEIHRQRDATT